MLDSMRQAGFNLERVTLTCNRDGCDPNNLSLEDVRETVKLPVRASVPDDWDTVCSAMNLGEPLATHAPKSRVRTAIRDLAERLHRRESKADEKGAVRKSGLFSKIFSDA